MSGELVPKVNWEKYDDIYKRWQTTQLINPEDLQFVSKIYSILHQQSVAHPDDVQLRALYDRIFTQVYDINPEIAFPTDTDDATKNTTGMP